MECGNLLPLHALRQSFETPGSLILHSHNQPFAHHLLFSFSLTRWDNLNSRLHSRENDTLRKKSPCWSDSSIPKRRVLPCDSSSIREWRRTRITICVEQTTHELVLFVATKKRVSIGVVDASHSVSPVILKGPVLPVGHIQTGEPHIPEGYGLHAKGGTTSLNEWRPFPPVGVNEATLKESERAEDKNGNEVALGQVLHDLVLDVPDVSISPEHDGTKGNGLGDGEEEIQGDGSAKHVVEAAAGE